MHFRKPRKNDRTIHHPWKVVSYKNAYALVDKRRIIVAEGLSKVAADEIVTCFETLSISVDHLQKIITTNNVDATVHAVHDAHEFLKSIDISLQNSSKVLDLNKVTGWTELL